MRCCNFLLSFLTIHWWLWRQTQWSQHGCISASNDQCTMFFDCTSTHSDCWQLQMMKIIFNDWCPTGVCFGRFCKPWPFLIVNSVPHLSDAKVAQPRQTDSQSKDTPCFARHVMDKLRSPNFQNCRCCNFEQLWHDNFCCIQHKAWKFMNIS